MRRGWLGYALTGCALVAGYPWLPQEVQNTIYDVVSASAVVAILVGIRTNRVRPAAPWYLFACGQAFFTVADTMWNLTYDRLGRIPTPSYLDALYLAYYPLVAIGLFLLARQRGRRSQSALILDALLAAVAAAVLIWIMIRQSVLDPTVSLGTRLTNLGYPVGDLVLVVPLLRLAIDPGRRSQSFRLLLASLVLTTTADLIYLVSTAQGTFTNGSVTDAIWLLGYVAFGTAALHPTMTGLGSPGADASFRIGRGRVAMTAATLLVIPVFLLFNIRLAPTADSVVLALGATGFCGLLLIRIITMVRQLEEAIGRERILRTSGVDLVGATTHEEISRITQRAARRLVGPTHPTLVQTTAQAAASAEAAAATSAEAGAGAGGCDQVGPGTGANLVVPIETESGPHPTITIACQHRLDPFVVFSLRALAAAAALAWDSVTREGWRTDSERRFRSIVYSSSDIMLLTKPNGTITWCGESIERICGYRLEDVVGRPVHELLHPDDTTVITYFAEALTTANATARTDCRLRLSDGSYRIFQVTGQNLLLDDAVHGVLFTGLDVTERRELADQLVERAFYDHLTGLANRALFTDRLERALARNEQDGHSSAVLLIGLDGFKTVNESLGHQAGDELLTQTANRLNSDLRASDTAARLGGDEFAVLLDAVTTDEADSTARRFLRALGTSFIVDEREVFISASIGVVTTDLDHRDPESLLRDAEIAMHRAKSMGKNRCQPFRPSMRADAVRRLELHGDLQRAMERSEFVVFYQPIIDLVTGRTASFEALIRWQHPVHGLIGPTKFVPFAEETGLVVGLGRWVLNEACRQAKRWQDRFSPTLTMAVNLSVRQVADDNLLTDVAEALQRSGLPASRLTLELTESALMADIDLAASRLQALRSMGVRIAIDDFGTGYSSLSYLDRLPIDIIKIDRSFVTSLDDPSREPTLVRIMVDLGHRLGIPVVAEGIESEHQRDRLRLLGCPLGQGFLFSPPKEHKALEEFLVTQFRAEALAPGGAGAAGLTGLTGLTGGTGGTGGTGPQVAPSAKIIR